MARKRITVVGLSFLDAMTCGFGAVILFFMIINASVDQRREAIVAPEFSAVERIELRLIAARRNLVQLRNERAEQLEEQAQTKGLSEEVLAEISKLQEEFAELSLDTTVKKESIEQLQAELESLEEETKRLSAASITPEQAGNRIRSVTGEGNRQYLTGLRMGGKRIVILLDVSTSMLDRTLVNVLRRRNMSEGARRRAPKWRQAVATVDWLTAQVAPGTQFQIYAFNTEAWSLVEGTDEEWLTASDGSQLQAAVTEVRKLVPSGGSSLAAAAEAMSKLSPKPDNVYLLTDGLPTQGLVEATDRGVSGRERMRHFQRAVRRLPLNVPINVILYPMEGDPNAAWAFWELALNTGGSLLSPAEGWP